MWCEYLIDIIERYNDTQLQKTLIYSHILYKNWSKNISTTNICHGLINRNWLYSISGGTVVSTEARNTEGIIYYQFQVHHSAMQCTTA